MDGIFFLLLAFLTIYLSIKLSYYGDLYSKESKVGSMFIGGILIASITSLPEFITSVSATIINNPLLSFGDILGSDFFNLFVLGVYNIYFFKKDVFKNASQKYIFECINLIISYIFILLGSLNKLVFLTSVILVINYIIYLYSIFKNPDSENESNYDVKEKYVLLKFVFTAVLMVILSVLLTLEADKLSHLYPSFSSSSIGAILLGITTSLPEVVTTFSLLNMNNYNMAISNMLGSNIFNFLILSISDFLYKDNFLYLSADIHSYTYLIGGLLITIVFIFNLIFKNKNRFYYIFLSFLMILLYFLVWYLQFN